MSELLIIVIVIASLVLILTFLLSFIVKNTNNLMKNVFVDRMSEFDFLLEDKEKKVDELNDDIKKKTEIVEALEEKAKEFDNNDKVKKDEMVMPKFTDFEDGNIFYNYKVIKKAFNYDPVEILNKFLSKNKGEEIEEYEILKTIRNYFSFDVIYKISLYQPNEQLEIIKSLLSDKEFSIIEEYVPKGKFNLKRFVDKLDEQIIKKDPIIKVLVSSEDMNFNNLDKNIVTVYDSKITEGFKIVYKGVIYDYSI